MERSLLKSEGFTSTGIGKKIVFTLEHRKVFRLRKEKPRNIGTNFGAHSWEYDWNAVHIQT